MVLIFDAIEGREVFIAECFFGLAIIRFLLLSKYKLIIRSIRFKIATLFAGELYVDGNCDSKCLGMKSECELISDLPNITFGSK